MISLKILVASFCLCLYAGIQSHALEVAGPFVPSSVSVIFDGDLSWTNPSGAIGSDDNRATISLADPDFISHSLYFTGFGANLPDDAVLSGVVLQVEGYRTVTAANASYVGWATTNDGLTFGFTTLRTGAPPGTGDFVDVPVGRFDRDWGGLTTPDLENPDFGIKLAVAISSDPITFFIDHVNMIIYYSVPAPVVTVTPKTTYNFRPELTGTVDKPDSTISVTVDGQTLAATNNGDGTWTLSENSLVALAFGTYDVVVTATTPGGTVGVDSTTNELTIAEKPVGNIFANLAPPNIGVGVRLQLWAPEGSGYRWKKDGVNLVSDGRIIAVTSRIMTIDPLALADAGNYTVVYDNGQAVVETPVFPVVVLLDPAPAVGIGSTMIALSLMILAGLGCFAITSMTRNQHGDT